VTIGELTTDTGNCAAPGIPAAKGVAMAVKQINAHPFTVKGKKYKINLITKNTGGSNTTAVNDLVSLTQDDGAKIVVGPGCGAYIEPGLGPLAMKEKILLFNPTPTPKFSSPKTAAQLTSVHGPGYLIAISQATGTQTTTAQASLVTSFPKSDHIHNVYELLENDAEGHFLAVPLAAWFNSHGYKATINYYPTTTQDFSGYLSAAKAAHADLLMYGYGDPSGLAILKQAVAGNTAPNYYGYGSSLTDTLNINGTTGITSEQLTLAYPVSLVYPTNTKIKTFAAQYKAYNGGKFTSDSSYAAYLYDDPGLLVKAMEKAGTTTTLRAIAKALYSLHYDGLLSSDEYFDSSHHLHFNVDGCVTQSGADPATHVTCTSVKQ